MAEVVFLLGDRLPLIYDAAIAIYSVSKKHDSAKRTATIHTYAVALQDIWERAFGKVHVANINTIKHKLVMIMKDYRNKVHTNVRRKKKHAGSSTLAYILSNL